MVTSTLAPKSISRLQGAGLALIMGIKCFEMDKRLKQPGHWGDWGVGWGSGVG